MPAVRLAVTVFCPSVPPSFLPHLLLPIVRLSLINFCRINLVSSLLLCQIVSSCMVTVSVLYHRVFENLCFSSVATFFMCFCSSVLCHACVFSSLVCRTLCTLSSTCSPVCFTSSLPDHSHSMPAFLFV